MRTHWNVCGMVLLGAGLLGAAVAGCGKTRVLTKIVEPQPQVEESVVSGVTLAVDPSTFSGECPGYFTLSGSIAVTETTLVVYRWERSDGNSGPIPVDLPPGTSPVATVWSSPPAGSNWARLHVLVPDDIVSDQVSFANRCFELTVGVTAHVDHATYSGPCPSAFEFSAAISCNAARTVQYRWEGSDGTMGQEQVLTFDRAGAQTVRFSRSLIVAGTWTERVHILAPRDTFSAAVPFTSACQGVAVQAVVSGGPYTDPCNGVFNFDGQVTTNASTVTCQWEFSDGTTSRVETLNFSAPGTQTVSMTWGLPSETGWARLHILTPLDVMSNQAGVEYDCCWGCGDTMRMRAKAAERLRQARH
jgi:hypothetical protein